MGRGTLAALFALCVLAASGENAGDWRQSPPEGVAVGDLAFRKGHGLWTGYFIGMSTREKRFSHVGIVSSVKGGKATIIHSEAGEFTGQGAVKEDDWSFFFGDALEGAVYRYSGGRADAPRLIAEEGRKMIGVPFDSAFDMSETNRLYCTEFARIAVNRALGEELIGHSTVNGRDFITLDDMYRRDFGKIWDSEM